MKLTGKLERRNMKYGYLFISPMMLGFVLFMFAPIVAVLVLSLTDYSFMRPETNFLGFGHYAHAFTNDPILGVTIRNTLYFSAGLIPLNLLLALSLALLLNRKLPGIGLFRTAIFTPVVISIVVWSIVWKYIFATDAGLINQLLRIFGITGPSWLYDEALAIPVVIVVSVLKKVGMNMVIFLAALQDVPAMFYEASRIDGASRWRQFRHITLPMISPAIFLTFIITLIGSLKVFSQIAVMTEGGPGTSSYVLVYYIYQLGFRRFEFGYASAIASLLFVLILALTLIQWHMRKRWVHHEQ